MINQYNFIDTCINEGLIIKSSYFLYYDLAGKINFIVNPLSLKIRIICAFKDIYNMTTVNCGDFISHYGASHPRLVKLIIFNIAEFE